MTGQSSVSVSINETRKVHDLGIRKRYICTRVWVNNSLIVLLNVYTRLLTQCEEIKKKFWPLVDSCLIGIENHIFLFLYIEYQY